MAANLKNADFSEHRHLANSFVRELIFSAITMRNQVYKTAIKLRKEYQHGVKQHLESKEEFSRPLLLNIKLMTWTVQFRWFYYIPICGKNEMRTVSRKKTTGELKTSDIPDFDPELKELALELDAYIQGMTLTLKSIYNIMRHVARIIQINDLDVEDFGLSNEDILHFVLVGDIGNPLLYDNKFILYDILCLENWDSVEEQLSIEDNQKAICELMPLSYIKKDGFNYR